MLFVLVGFQYRRHLQLDSDILDGLAVQFCCIGQLQHCVLDKITHLQVDQGMHQDLSPVSRIPLIHRGESHDSLDQSQSLQLIPMEQAKLQGVVQVVSVVGDAIAGVDNLEQLWNFSVPQLLRSLQTPH